MSQYYRERTRSTVGEVMLTFELVDYRIHTSQTMSANLAACELRVNHKKSWSFNLRLNLKIANFWVRLHGANQQANHRWLSFQPNL